MRIDSDLGSTPKDLAVFKQSFRKHAAGVSIITTLSAEASPVGFTATSLASLSAIPPMATFNMARSASSWPAIASAERVIIHTLSIDNVGIATIMSQDASLRFDGDHWETGPYGMPLLRDVTSWMVAKIVQRIPVYDNGIVVAQIEDGAVGVDGEALLYNDRKFLRPSALG